MKTISIKKSLNKITKQLSIWVGVFLVLLLVISCDKPTGSNGITGNPGNDDSSAVDPLPYAETVKLSYKNSIQKTVTADALYDELSKIEGPIDFIVTGNLTDEEFEKVVKLADSYRGGKQWWAPYLGLDLTQTTGITSIPDCIYFAKSLGLPYSIQTLDDYDLGTNTYIYWPSDFNEKNQNFIDEDGVLYSKDKTKLIYYSPLKTDTSFDIPETVKQLYSGTFNQNKKLKNITINGDFSYKEREALFPNNLNVKINKSNTLVLEDDVLFTKDKKTLIHYPNSKQNTTYTVPSGVTIIGPSAFSNNTYITEVKLPSSLLEISSYSFAYCTNLKTLTIPANVNSFASYAVISTGLESLKFEDPNNWYFFSWQLLTKEDLENPENFISWTGKFFWSYIQKLSPESQ